MNIELKKANLESVKELGRVLLLAAVPVLIDSLSTNTFSWRVTGVALSIAVLRAIDKWVHENKNVEAKGIMPF